MPLKSLINQETFHLLEIVVLAVVRLPSDLVVEETGEIAKLESSGLIDINVPVSITIGSSLLWHNV